jgi:hypothetical protein
MVADWEKIGRKIRNQRLKVSLAEKELIESQDTQGCEFVVALMGHRMGISSQYLVEHLRSTRPLSSDDREILARFFEGSIQLPRGTPTNWRAHEAAKLAKAIYREWKAKNSCEGIANRGLGESMKHKASEYAVEILESLRSYWSTSDEHLVETVRELMDRPKRRQKWK